MLIKTFTLSALALVAACASVNAAMVVDNLSTNGAAYASTGSSVGQSFLTGSSLLALDDVVIDQLGGSKASGYTNGYVSGETLSLYSDTTDASGHLPNFATGLLGGFTLTNTNTAGSGFAQTEGVPLSPISLTAGTRYWLVLSTGSATTTYWSAADTPDYGYAQNTQAGWSLPTDSHTGYKAVGGAQAPSTYYAYAAGPQLLYIDAVPEPSTYCLMAVAGLALVVGRKRKLA